MHDQAQDPRHPGQINRVQMYSGRRMSFLLSFVFLFPGSQDTGKQKGKNTENTACKGCGPEELQRKAGIYQLKIDQDQYRRDTNDGQDDGYDIKRHFYIHDDSFPEVWEKKNMVHSLSSDIKILYHPFHLFQVPDVKDFVFCWSTEG